MPNYVNVPVELRERPQWICWRYEQTNGSKPTKVPYVATTGLRADITSPNCWSVFDVACDCATKNGYAGIGFCLSRDDEFIFIDLDDPQGDTQLIQSHNFIYSQFANTYAELSPSGTGVHIIGKGSIPTALKRHKVELYAFDRYMTVTGDVLNNAPISDVQSLVTQLYNDMGGNVAAKVKDVPDNPERLTDHAVWANACTAENGELFQQLWRGDWSSYPSQSEADLALVDFLQFHSGNVEQIVRLFRQSGLGQRQKANRDDYVFGMVAKSFDRARMTELPPSPEMTAKHQAEIRSWRTEHTNETNDRSFVDLLPSGLVSDIASYIYNASPYPLPEAAILAALGLVSGIAGRTYNISNDVGLNQYLMLIATSGTGKEGMKDGVSRLMYKLGEKGHGFIGPGTLASAQGLNRRFADTPHLSMVSVLPEFGPFMRSMTYARAGSNDDTLKGFLLKLYTANGRGKVLGDTSYSDKTKNMSTLISPSYSILTEAEPEGFFKSFDRDMISGGLIPRFTMVEYKGDLPSFNYNRQLEPHVYLLNNLGMLTDIVRQLATSDTVIDVVEDSEASKMLDDFRKWSREQAFNSDYELRPLWNRSHIRVWKIAGVLALRDYRAPVITKQDVDFAIAIEKQYIENLIKKLETGAIGDPVSETRQEQFVYDVLADYINTDYERLSATARKRISPEMKRDLVVPRAFLQQRTGNAAPFRKTANNYGRTGEDALKMIIGRLIDAGDISKPINDATAQMTYGSKQVMYRIDNVRAILDRSGI